MAGEIEIRGSKNLGLIKAIHVGINPPLNKRILWFDDNTAVKIHKYYNFQQSLWLPLGGNGSVTINGHYVYIAFSSDCDGADFAFVFDENIHTHTAIISSNIEIAPIDLTLDKFIKKFIRFCGDEVLGNYVYVGFADDDQGTNFALVPTYETECPTCAFVESYTPLNINPLAGRDYLLNPTANGFNLDLNIKTPNTLEIQLEIDGQPLTSGLDYSIEIQVPPTFPGKFFARLDNFEVGGYFVEGTGLPQTLKFLKTNQSSILYLEFYEDGLTIQDELFVRIGSASCINPEVENEVCTKTRSCFAIINSDTKIEDEDLVVGLFEGKWFCTCCDDSPAYNLQNIMDLINSLIQGQIDIRNEFLQEITNLMNLITNLQNQITSNYNTLNTLIVNNHNTVIGWINEINSQIIDILSLLEIHETQITNLFQQFSVEIFDPRVIEIINQYGGIVSAEERMENLLNSVNLDLKWKLGARKYNKLKEEITAGVQDGYYTRTGFISQERPTITVGNTLDYGVQDIWTVSEINNLIVDIKKETFAKFVGHTPKIIITRYKPTKNKHFENSFTERGTKHRSTSGFKQEKNSKVYKPSSIRIKKPYQILDIGQEHYFKHKLNNQNGIKFNRFYAVGLGNRSETKYRENNGGYDGTSNSIDNIWIKRASVYLEFHLEINFNWKIIRSKPLSRLKMSFIVKDNFAAFPDVNDPGYLVYNNSIKFKHV